MYRLILTHDELDAFDWVGDCYSAGDVMDLLDSLYVERIESEDSVTYLIPEHVAWEIKDLADAESRLWPCFSDPLRDKLNTFLDTIV